MAPSVIGFVVGPVAFVYAFYVTFLSVGFLGNVSLIPVWPGWLKFTVAEIFPFNLDKAYVEESGLVAGNTFTTKLLMDLLLLLFFAVPHTLLSLPTVKKFCQPGTPSGGVSVFRSISLLVSSLGLHLVMLCWQPVGSWMVWNLPPTVMPALVYLPIFGPVIFGPFLVSLLYVPFMAAVVWTVSAFFAVDVFAAFGLKQATGIDLQEKYFGSVSSSGLVLKKHYRVVRHPIPVGVFIMLFLSPVFTLNRLLFGLATAAYVCFFVSQVEEPALRKAHPEAYATYELAVAAYLPAKLAAALPSMDPERLPLFQK